ncbi:trans-acting t-cell-specific transcription factor gata-3 [Anaeramoeba flamelloides]|uniref:Trans-acting t-cell-specific transcription factor gata-3 n=1 Tax=Anaeramoeba flamelloides TaxID=1746091 RepID=A0ABQ8XXN8_9EUKA|nr:trans-acting t-cell-specific transcription factor gata-3 [Anaeramoeba flamelloides]
MTNNIRCSNENCRTETTPIWRKIGTQLFCNACAIYSKRHNGQNRPLSQVQNDNNKLIRKIITINRPKKYFRKPKNPRRNSRTTRTHQTTFVFKNTYEKHKNIKNSNKKAQKRKEKEKVKEKEKEKEKVVEEEIGKDELYDEWKDDNYQNDEDSEYNKEEEFGDDDDDDEYNENEDDAEVDYNFSRVEEPQKDKDKEEEKPKDFYTNYKGSLTLKELLNEQQTDEIHKKNQVSDSAYRKRKKKLYKRGTKTKRKPKQWPEPFESTSYLKTESSPKESGLGNPNCDVKRKSISPFFHKSNSENEMDQIDHRNRSNRIHRNHETNNNLIGYNFDITTRLNNSSNFIFDTNSSFITTSESSTSFDHDLQEDVFKFSSRTKKRKKLRKRRKKQIISETENKSVNFKRNECVAIRSNENQEIFAIIKGFYRSTKTNNIYIKVRWLLPKIHPFHPQWKLLNTKQLQKSDFQLGELESIYQPISSVTRKLNFRFDDEKNILISLFRETGNL